MALRKPLVLAPGAREIATGDGLLVQGHISGAGAGAPTVSAGTLLTGSSDLRGGVTLAAGTTSVTVTFASAFATGPWPSVTVSGLSISVAVTAKSATAMTLAVSANLTGLTIYWTCLE